MSAPSFVGAALGEPAPSHIRVQRRTLFVARPEDVTSSHVLCGLIPSADDSIVLATRAGLSPFLAAH